MSDTSKSSESRSSRKSGPARWNPIRRIVSMVTGAGAGGSGSSEESTESDTSGGVDGDKIIFRWTAACLNTTCPIFSKSPQFNMIYCPAPSLLMFVVVTLSSENAMTKMLSRLFEISDDELEAIREMFAKINALCSPNAFYCFVRFLVDEERTTTVSKELMAKSTEVGAQQVFSSIRPSRVVRYLNSLTFQPVQLPRPSLLTTNGYGSAGLIGTWIGRTRRAGTHRFACSYHKKKLERFFEMRTAYKRVMTDTFEVFEVPFKTAHGQPGSLLLLRPHFLGHLPYANRQITAESLQAMIQQLAATEWTPQARLLLPQFAASGCHDLWKNLMRHGVQPDLGQSQKAPPMATLWHWASLTVSSDGIGNGGGGGEAESRKSRRNKSSKQMVMITKKKKKQQQKASQRALEQAIRGRVSGESLFEKHKTYSARVDSPFTYLILVNGTPIFTGSYFGSPPPKSSELFVNAPERIRHRRHRAKTRHRRPKPKETRKQKLWRKIRKSEEREREKDRRRDEKERKQKDKLEKRMKKKKKASDDDSTESIDGATTSSERSVKASLSETTLHGHEEPPKEQKSKKKEKSKSSGWRRLANIFRRK